MLLCLIDGYVYEILISLVFNNETSVFNGG